MEAKQNNRGILAHRYILSSEEEASVCIRKDKDKKSCIRRTEVLCLRKVGTLFQQLHGKRMVALTWDDTISATM